MIYYITSNKKLRGLHGKKTQYSDESNDDFAGTKINTQDVGTDFPFIHRNVFWKIAEFIVYYIIVVPIVFAICKLWFGLRIVNRKAIKKVRKTGCYLYGNHTTVCDAFTPSMLSLYRKSFIVVGRDTVSIKGIRWLVQMLGAIPLPSDFHAKDIFRDAVYERRKSGAFVTIYPEAHIWPYYTDIRPFSPASFLYPVEDNAPVVAFVTTFRKRRFLKFIKRPLLTVYVSEPFYPDTSLPPREARQHLRDKVFGYMKAIAASAEQVQYVKYEKAQDN